MGKLCSKFGEYWSMNNVTFLSTDAGRTDGRLRDFTFCPMHMHSIGQTTTVCKMIYYFIKHMWHAPNKMQHSTFHRASSIAILHADKISEIRLYLSTVVLITLNVYRPAYNVYMATSVKSELISIQVEKTYPSSSSIESGS